MTRTLVRGRKVPRKPDGYAELDCRPELLRSLISRTKYEDKPLTIRRLSDLCDLRGHAHISRLVSGTVKTTSLKTARQIELVLHEEGNLFVRHPARTLVQVQSEEPMSLPAPRRAA